MWTIGGICVVAGLAVAALRRDEVDAGAIVVQALVACATELLRAR